MRQQGGGRGVAHFSGGGEGNLRRMGVRERGWRKGKGAALKYAEGGKAAEGRLKRKLYSGQCSPAQCDSIIFAQSRRDGPSGQPPC